MNKYSSGTTLGPLSSGNVFKLQHGKRWEYTPRNRKFPLNAAPYRQEWKRDVLVQDVVNSVQTLIVKYNSKLKKFLTSVGNFDSFVECKIAGKTEGFTQIHMGVVKQKL